ncbi:hypothetical protein K8Z61_00485 [Nocardioides sp. TRM66260-LWL]|uniref:hypothetical protein n=1 Tax=Nocardioides sp. TRM66260-LWL TaxID=2874478 RepID=UPI001CC4C7E0|nr:hypothetical protein [Nocardioides sp. TRM66260-LWL]MBZ5732963.1 hypothetical protein [Nocardioides sp. TRM66260-LWL]
MVFTIVLGGFHTAHLDPVTGCGLVVCPRPELDVWLDDESVLGAAWVDATRKLARAGWAPIVDAQGLLRYEGVTEDGSLVASVAAERGLLPATPATLDHETWSQLCQAAGLVGVSAPRA